eukprot:6210999-Pleurochrysis_carterae.AAC.1
MLEEAYTSAWISMETLTTGPMRTHMSLYKLVPACTSSYKPYRFGPYCAAGVGESRISGCCFYVYNCAQTY